MHKKSLEAAATLEQAGETMLDGERYTDTAEQRSMASGTSSPLPPKPPPRMPHAGAKRQRRAREHAAHTATATSHDVKMVDANLPSLFYAHANMQSATGAFFSPYFMNAQ
jgi:hypothetical protein